MLHLNEKFEFSLDVVGFLVVIAISLDFRNQIRLEFFLEELIYFNICFKSTILTHIGQITKNQDESNKSSKKGTNFQSFQMKRS